MAINSFSSLRTAISSWLARSDLDTQVYNFIILAEAKFNRDPRLQTIVQRALTVSSATVTLPTDFKALVSLYGDSTALRGPIEIVPPEKLAEIKAQYGATGKPIAAAKIGSALHFAPAPDGVYSLTLAYEGGVPALTEAATTNWLLAAHPDVYLYGALVESAPYLKDDERIATWGALLEKATEEVAVAKERERYGGRMVIRPRQTLG
jgi:hypothetical protein